jgi:ABC-2 type transport system permease protein
MTADARSTPAAAASAAGLGSPEWGGFDPSRIRGGGLRDLWRSFVTATRLGWQMEANWTDPLLFFIYSVAKPISSTLIFVVMIEVIGGPSTGAFRGFVVVGTALWAFVLSGISGLAWAILEDRERYRMLKYVVVSPSDIGAVLLGRGVARVAVGAMGAVITLAVGVIALGVPFDPGRVDWPLLVVVMAGGLVTLVAVGVLLAAVCIQTRQEAWSYPEAVAGALFLVIGGVFPLAVLPAPVQVIGWLAPFTWWMEGARLALFPGGVSGVGGAGSAFASFTGRLRPEPYEIVVALLATGALVTLAAIAGFRVSLHRAKDRGLLDQTTGS